MELKLEKQGEMGKIEVTKRRNFGGKTEGFESKQEKHFEQRHLKAYLKGHKKFKFGFKTLKGGVRVPKTHDVKEVWV